MPPRSDKQEPAPGVTHIHHHHEAPTPVERSYRREMPVNPDPLATFDALGRKQPKRLGFMEVVRGLPWAMRERTGEVPGEMIARVGDDEVEIPCVCKATTIATHNRLVECEGACGRSFWSIAGKVYVFGGHRPDDVAAPSSG